MNESYLKVSESLYNITMTSYTNIVAAIDNIVSDAKLSMLDDVQKFILDKVDEDSSNAIKELFEEYRSKFTKELAEAKKSSKKLFKEKGKKDKKPKTDRKPSAYNIFVGEKIKEIRTANPGMVAKEAMKLAMAAWKEQKSR